MQYKVDFDPPLECPISRVIVCVPSKGQEKGLAPASEQRIFLLPGRKQLIFLALKQRDTG
jgi:hypothetical protein